MRSEAKQAAWIDALKHMRRFCVANKLREPIFMDARASGGKDAFGQCFRHGFIKVDVQKCELEHTDPLDDNTVLGVASHELGHFWHAQIGEKKLTQLFVQRCGEEPFVTKYERWFWQHPSYGRMASRCVAESIAEAFMLFVTQPDLLKTLGPARYDLLTSHGLVECKSVSMSNTQ